MAFTSGITTGLLGFSLKKEMMGDALFFRETATYSYELYVVDLTGQRPINIHNTILSEFQSRYSGDINVKVFQQPTEYFFPNDSIRTAKYNVEVQVKSVPNVGLWQPELASGGQNYYRGLNSGFFTGSGLQLLDFKENFDFETADNGNQTFSHDIAFGLLTGNRNLANAIASGIFGGDKDTTFGISTMVGGLATIADSSVYQNYYTESFDTIRNVYSFGRKREVLPSGAATYVYNLNHAIDIREDGIMDVTERGNVKGKINFLQAQQGADALIGTAYPRCTSFYSTYSALGNNFSTPVSLALVNLPVKVTRMLNRPAISVDYEVGFTNNPLFKSDGTMVEETIDVNDMEVGLVDVKHTIDFSLNKRTSTTNFSAMMDAAVTRSPATVSGYYTPAVWPLKHIKKDLTWPNRKPKGARVVMQYNNHPRYFVTINGNSYRVLDYRVTHNTPVDMVSEYKIINRPNKLSIINYAYQTERGQLNITIDAGIGRNPDEFITSFRTDIGTHLFNLYQYATTLFFGEFKNQIPLAFTYYLEDVKYTYNSENGTLQLVTTFTYALKKYTR